MILELKPTYFLSVVDESAFDFNVIPEAEELYIQIDEEGNHVNYPVLASNLRGIYGNFLPGNPPEGWKPFYRKRVPNVIDKFVKLKEVYKRNPDGSFQDDWQLEPVNAEEKEKILEQLKVSNHLSIEYTISKCEEFILAAESEADKAVYIEYIAYLRELQQINAANTLEYLHTDIRPFPRKDADGDWVSLNKDGVPPDVI